MGNWTPANRVKEAERRMFRYIVTDLVCIGEVQTRRVQVQTNYNIAIQPPSKQLVRTHGNHGGAL
ncbi:uncharacterized protein N7496_000097 [Penicillium cataractarum]|uniref:Uncharacterized protein n=1 Tax=Penicillium cataractarum TaxID=2100454 RepID=A0A9X0B5L0_9EURO|nr:uncharacterized protein N7496_000097 [Penicillium cataractarum]KAJ5389029.1 hypothetical protein N7496_000097 [Penicillium cataractarum]